METEDRERLMPVSNMNLEQISGFISVSCYLVILLAMMSVIAACATVLIPNAVPAAKHIFIALGCIMSVMAVLVMILLRRKYALLVMWTWISAAWAGFLIGVSVAILAPHVLPTPMPGTSS